MSTRLTWLILMVLLAMPSFSLAQEETTEDKEEKSSKPVPFVMAGVVAGGSIDRGNVIYKEGLTLQAGLAWKKTKRLHLGFFVGADKLRDEVFLPVGLSIKAFTSKKDESFMLGLQSGYAHGFSDRLYGFVDYRFRGGLFFNPFIGYKTEIKKTALLFAFGYKHQFSEIRYYGDQNYTQPNSFHLLSLRAGVLF